MRDAGRELVADVEAKLVEHRTKAASEMAGELRRYFDASTGSIPQLMDGLTRTGGQLDRLLRQHVGGEDASTLAQTLIRHVGSQSPLLQMLSPEQKSGLLARLQESLQAALQDQRAKLLGEFDMNRPESALARLVQRVGEGQGTLEKNFSETIGKLASEWSLDNEGSSIVRFKKELHSTIDDLSKRQLEFQQTVMKEFEGMRARRQVEAGTTRKGATFEEALGQLLQSEAARRGEVFQAVGAVPGAVKYSKKGDFLVEMGSDSIAPGETIAVEAKADRSYGVKDILAEMEDVRKNRQAQVGIFVMGAGVAPEGMPRFQRHGMTLVVVWDPEDPATDLRVSAALEVARALLVRRARQDTNRTAGIADLDTAIAQMERDLQGLEEIRRFATTIQTSSTKVLEEVTKLQTKVARQVLAVKEAVDTLRPAEGADPA